MEDVLVVGEGARTPQEHCPRTLEHGTDPTNIHRGPCWQINQGWTLRSVIV